MSEFGVVDIQHVRCIYFAKNLKNPSSRFLSESEKVCHPRVKLCVIMIYMPR